VLFEAGARTRWHTHSGEQILLCLRGTCVVQVFGKTSQVLPEGIAFRIPAGVVHWHGALRGPASHLAVNVAALTTWMGEVTAGEYQQAEASVAAFAAPSRATD
jgi:quercetin dioxygenase-like cupin family protein